MSRSEAVKPVQQHHSHAALALLGQRVFYSHSEPGLPARSGFADVDAVQLVAPGSGDKAEVLLRLGPSDREYFALDEVEIRPVAPESIA